MDFWDKIHEGLEDIHIVKRCEDCCFGKIDGYAVSIVGNQGTPIAPDDCSRLVLILESPHRNELKKLFVPAQGRAGKMLEKRFEDVFGKWFDGYALCIVNAVQYPCSLSLTMNYRVRALRDAIFRACLSDTCYVEDLKTRVLKYFRPNTGDVIINACTLGVTRIKSATNKSYVTDVVKNLCSENNIQKENVCIERVCHPASDKWDDAAELNEMRIAVDDFMNKREELSVTTATKERKWSHCCGSGGEGKECGDSEVSRRVMK